jgi:hypothetical protein
LGCPGGGSLSVVVQCAPRIDARLVGAISRIDDGRRPIAETYREVSAVAKELELARPSYEQVRTVLHQLRARQRDPAIGQILLDISLQRRHPEALLHAVSGVGVPRLT